MSDEMRTTCNRCFCDISDHCFDMGWGDKPIYQCWERPHPYCGGRCGCKRLFVVAAAIKHPDGTVYRLPPPNRHHNVIKHMVDQGIDTYYTIDDQGFVLSNGEYASREDAKVVAKRADQLLDRASSSKQLFSEDVW